MSYFRTDGNTERCTLPGSYELSGAHRTGTHNTRELLDLAASHGYEGVWAERLVGAVIVGLARHGTNHGLIADKRGRLRYYGPCSSGYVSRPDAERAVKLGLAADAKLAHDEAEADDFDFALAEAQFKDADESYFCCLDPAREYALLLLSDAFDNEVDHSCPRDRPSNHAWRSVNESYAEAVACLEDDDDANHLFPALLLANGALVMTDADQSALGCLSEASVVLHGPCLDGSDEDADLATRVQEHYDGLSDGERDIEVLAAHPQEDFDALTARESLVLHLLTMHPGSAVPDLAEFMGIEENCLYSVMSALYEKGCVVKEGRGWFAA